MFDTKKFKKTNSLHNIKYSCFFSDEFILGGLPIPRILCREVYLTEFKKIRMAQSTPN